MSLVFTISDWSVFSHFAYLQVSHILTLACLSKIVMTRQKLFSEEKFFKYMASKRVRNILGKVVDKRLEEKIIQKR